MLQHPAFSGRRVRRNLKNRPFEPEFEPRVILYSGVACSTPLLSQILRLYVFLGLPARSLSIFPPQVVRAESPMLWVLATLDGPTQTTSPIILFMLPLSEKCESIDYMVLGGIQKVSRRRGLLWDLQISECYVNLLFATQRRSYDCRG